MSEGWRAEFERRALRASGAPADAAFGHIEVSSEYKRWSEWTSETDEWLDVVWSDPHAGKPTHRQWGTMAELLTAMDQVEDLP